MIIIALNYFVQFIQIMILIRALMSWIRIDPYSSLYSFIYNVTEPILGPVRELMNRYFSTGSIDFSPLVAMWLIGIFYNMALRVLSLIMF